MSVVHLMALGCVWLTVALSAVVFSEPAPFDILMMGLILLLPIVGLAKFNAANLGLLGIWLIIGAAGLVSSILAPDIASSSRHTAITIYLSIASVILAAFVAQNPLAHGRLMMNAYLVAAVIASAAAIIGYFNLLPGFEKLFTLYGRARGTFKDPNVFGAFLVPAFIYCLHIWLTRPMRSAPVILACLALLSLGALLSFSRGAWAVIGLGSVLYLYLVFATTVRDAVRLKIILLSVFGLSSLVLFTAVALQFDAVSDLLLQRASLDQSYDQGPEGRFGGQRKALSLIVEQPLGIGALTFGRHYHGEEAHNVYLSMFLNSGWVGGVCYLMLVIVSILMGFRQVLRRTETQGLMIVALAAFTVTALEGWIIDTDHWRHFFVLLGLLWGLIIGSGNDRPRRADRRLEPSMGTARRAQPVFG